MSAKKAQANVSGKRRPADLEGVVPASVAEALQKEKEHLIIQMTLADAKVKSKDSATASMSTLVKELQTQLQQQDELLRQSHKNANTDFMTSYNLEQTIKTLEGQLHQAKTEIEELKLQPQQFAKEIETARKQTSERLSLRQRVNEQEGKLSKLEGNAKTMAEERKTLQTVLEDLQQQIHDLAIKAEGPPPSPIYTALKTHKYW